MDAEGQAIAKASLERRRQGIREQIEAKFRRKDSGVLWALVATNPVEDDAGRYAGALAMVTDITERKLAERALQESEERFRCLSEATFEGIVVNDQGQHLAVNAAFVAMMGYSYEEAGRMTALDFTAPEFFASSRIIAGAAPGGKIGMPGRATRSITLVPRAGTYRLHCSHFLHSSFGMTGTIVVR